jgi:hypothetical protein
VVMNGQLQKSASAQDLPMTSGFSLLFDQSPCQLIANRPKHHQSEVEQAP